MQLVLQQLAPANAQGAGAPPNLRGLLPRHGRGRAAGDRHRQQLKIRDALPSQRLEELHGVVPLLAHDVVPTALDNVAHDEQLPAPRLQHAPEAADRAPEVQPVLFPRVVVGEYHATPQHARVEPVAKGQTRAADLPGAQELPKVVEQAVPHHFRVRVHPVEGGGVATELDLLEGVGHQAARPQGYDVGEGRGGPHAHSPLHPGRPVARRRPAS
mmetsp:Transcript_13795/g.31285  ORF Transcript_13795/g.31285 Transcript_13795/m.31285 type:complete len:214 (+) Transcript_13795:326-967(+)